VLAAAGLRLHSVVKVRALLEHLRQHGAVPAGDVERALAFLAAAR